MPKSADKTPKKKASSSAKNDRKSNATNASGGGGGKKKTSTCTAKQLLGVIAEIGLLHNGKAPRQLVAKRAGYGSADNGSFKKAISRATQRGFIDSSSDKTVLELSSMGNQEAGDPPKLETNEEAHAKIREQLSKKMVEAFEFIADGKPYQREDVAAQLGYDSIKEQGFKKLLDRIKAKGFLEYVDKETIQLTDICFPNGRD